MKILVFGSSGFIGSHLSNTLKGVGVEVLGFERKPETTPTFLGDIKDRDAVIDAMSYCDRWVNLAGLLGTQEMIENPIPAVDVNIKGAINVFDAARMHKKPGLQIAVGNHWMNNPYSITKSTAERFALMYNKEHGTDIRVVRGMNVYGEGQKHRPIRKVFPNIVVPALLNKPITIYGTGEQVMDLIYVKDVCEILSRVLLRDVPNDIVYEAGAGRITINHAVDLVLELTGSTSEIRRVPMRPGEDKMSVVEISKKGWSDLKKIDYTPEDLTPMRIAFQKTIDWYKKNINEFPWED